MSLYVFPLHTNHLLIMSGLVLRIVLLCAELKKQNKQHLKLPNGPETIFLSPSVCHLVFQTKNIKP